MPESVTAVTHRPAAASRGFSLCCKAAMLVEGLLVPLVYAHFTYRDVLALYNSYAALPPNLSLILGSAPKSVHLFLALMWLAQLVPLFFYAAVIRGIFRAKKIDADESLGLALIAAGRIFSTVAILHLGTSFSILVEVRDLVTHGLYRHFRHPIYFGYVLTHVGIFITRSSWAVFCVVAIKLTLVGWRALLEERKLAKHCPAYLA